MNAAWRAIRGAWWLVVGLAGALLGALAIFVFWRPGGRSEAITWRPGEKRPETLRERARKEVERVRLEGELEKARVKTDAGSHRVALYQIEQTGKDDPERARQDLAKWLQENL